MEFSKHKWDKVIDSNDRLLSIGIKNVWEYRDLIGLFVRRDFVVYFKQTILGPLWYLIQPICTTIMHMIVFGNLAKLGTDGIPQVLFYFAGTILWSMFTSIIQVESNIFNTNKNIFGKVYFPRLTAVIAAAISEMLKVGIQMALFAMIYIYYACSGINVGFSINILLAIPVILWILFLAMGLGLIVSSVTTKYRDLALTITFFLTLWMYATPVAYPLSQVSGKLRLLFIVNPISAPIECFRIACFGAGSVPLESIVISVVCTIICFFGGLIMFNKNEKTFVDVI